MSVDYLLPGGTVLTKAYAVAPQSRFNIWVDFEDPQLASTAVSARVRSTNAVPIIVERAMWWPGDASTWHEGHNSAGAERTSTKWGLADGQVGGPFSVETYILIANTSSTGGTAQVTLVFEDGTTAVRQIALLPEQPRERAGQPDVPRGRGTTLRRGGGELRRTGPGDRRGASDVRQCRRRRVGRGFERRRHPAAVRLHEISCYACFRE